jgi:hypothetical protein
MTYLQKAKNMPQVKVFAELRKPAADAASFPVNCSSCAGSPRAIFHWISE